MSNTNLLNVPLFASLPEEALLDVDKILEKVELRDGQILFYEGDPGDSLFIILEGLVEIIKFYGSPDARLVAERERGEFIGETALFVRDGLRTATAVSRSQATLLRISHSDFDLLVNRWPGLAFEMLREVSVRFWERDNATIRDLQEKNQLLNQAYEELRAAQEQIIAKEMLERELRMARKIQQSILPNQLPRLAGFNFGVLIEPARAVGGDFFDVFLLGSGKVGIVIGDVSDKGVPAAIFMALVRSLVRAKASPGLSPRQVLDRVNKLIRLMNEENMFATVLYGILDQTSQELQYARAGHEVPLLFSDQGELISIPFEPGQPLGLFPEIAIDQKTIHLPPKGTVLFYTDGVTDTANKSGKLFDLEGLIQTAKANIDGSAQALCDRIWQAVKEHQGDFPQSDDLTLVAVSSVPAT